MEKTGIMDSTKLSNADTIRSRGVEYRGDVRPLARWLKCHVIAGLESNAILAYEFSSSNAHDITYYKTLVDAAIGVFPLRHVLADEAYLSEEVIGWSHDLHRIRAVIPVKRRWDLETKLMHYEICKELVEWYENNRKEFDEVFRFRVKVEAGFSVLKRMFDGNNWSRGRPNTGIGASGLMQAKRNETLCKLIAYNLRSAVIQEHQTGYPIKIGTRTSYFHGSSPKTVGSIARRKSHKGAKLV